VSSPKILQIFLSRTTIYLLLDLDFREFENERAQMDAACERTRILEERLQREFEISQSTARILERIDAYIGRGQALEAENARLRE